MSENRKNQNAPNAWVDDLEAGEARVDASEHEVVQVNEQSDMTTAGGGRPVRESHQPADRTPHNRAFSYLLAALAIAIVVLVVGLALVAVGVLG